ncbi:MAG: hypothetical protein ACK4NN_04975 [Rheinheimera sp.]
MAKQVNMAVPTASPLFLREAEIRRGVELLYFGYSNLTRSIDEGLAAQGLGRAHTDQNYREQIETPHARAKLLRHLHF